MVLALSLSLAPKSGRIHDCPRAKIEWYCLLSLSHLFIFSFNPFVFLVAMSAKFNLKKPSKLAKAKGTKAVNTLPPTGDKGIHIDERLSKIARRLVLPSFSLTFPLWWGRH